MGLQNSKSRPTSVGQGAEQAVASMPGKIEVMQCSKDQLTKASKFLSYVLRHKPDAIGLKLDEKGWAFIDELIEKSQTHHSLTLELIRETVITNDKQRFQISEDGQRVRASQGHSIHVDLELTAQKPPVKLYHGTASRFLDSIQREGLKPGQRQHVHLSTNTETARAVGQRYGQPVILEIDAQAMHEEGHQFYLAENGVWLTSHVPNTSLTIAGAE